MAALSFAMQLAALKAGHSPSSPAVKRFALLFLEENASLVPTTNDLGEVIAFAELFAEELSAPVEVVLA